MPHGQLELLPTEGGEEQQWVLAEVLEHPSPLQQGPALVTRDKPAHLTRVVNCTVSDVKRPSQILFGKVQGLFILGWGEKYSSPLAMG